MDKRTGEIPNIAYNILLDELWYFTCPSCPRDGKIASDHLKSSGGKAWEIEGFYMFKIPKINSPENACEHIERNVHIYIYIYVLYVLYCM